MGVIHEVRVALLQTAPIFDIISIILDFIVGCWE
jgi:hypothetical protein